MIGTTGLIVSLPSRELRDAILPGALFQVKDLAGQPLSGTLRAALKLLAEACQEAGKKFLLIARPEIFLHGESRAWLVRQLDGIEDHLNISDGSTIQLIPGLKNHLFFYNPGLSRNMGAFEQFVGRAPEVPPQIGLQINTAFTFRIGQTSYAPQSLLLQARNFFPPGEPEHRQFYLNPNSVMDSVARIEAAPRICPEYLSGFTDIVYIPFTDSAACDVSFCRLVVKHILAAVKHPAGLLILGAPLAQGKQDTFAGMMSVLLNGLSRCGAVLPRAVLPNVLITSNLMDEDLFSPAGRHCRLVMHETFEFWRCPRSYYERFETLSVASRQAGRQDAPAMMDLLTEACGRMPETLSIEEEHKASIRASVLDE